MNSSFLRLIRLNTVNISLILPWIPPSSPEGFLLCDHHTVSPPSDSDLLWANEIQMAPAVFRLDLFIKWDLAGSNQYGSLPSLWNELFPFSAANQSGVTVLPHILTPPKHICEINCFRKGSRRSLPLCTVCKWSRRSLPLCTVCMVQWFDCVMWILVLWGRLWPYMTSLNSV